MALTIPPAVVRCLGFAYLRGRKVSRVHLFLLALSDWVLLFFLGRETTAAAPDLAGKRVVVAKIDHLGDVLMMTPFLRELRMQAPSCRVELLLGSWCADLAELLREDGLCDDFYFYDASILNKGRHSRLRKMVRGWQSFWNAVRRLRGAEVFIDLRPFFPNAILAARLAGVPHKIGFGLRGRSFLLQQRIRYEPDRALGDLFLGALETLGLRRVGYIGPSLARRSIDGIAGLPAPGTFVVVHPFSREQARMTRADLWVELVARLAEWGPVVVLGSREDGESKLAARLLAVKSCVSLAGRTTLGEAFAVVGAARGFVGIDSVFSHVALAYDRPTLILLTRNAGNATSFPQGHPRLLFIDPDAAGTSAEALAGMLARLAQIEA